MFSARIDAIGPKPYIDECLKKSSIICRSADDNEHPVIEFDPPNAAPAVTMSPLAFSQPPPNVYTELHPSPQLQRSSSDQASAVEISPFMPTFSDIQKQMVGLPQTLVAPPVIIVFGFDNE